MVVTPDSITSFQVDEEGNYQLAISKCIISYDAPLAKIDKFRADLAQLLPLDSRFQHVLQVNETQKVHKHSAFWSVDDDLYFLCCFVATGFRGELPELNDLIIGDDWASDLKVLEDVEGTSAYWKKLLHTTMERQPSGRQQCV
jgi:hypothetical protein